MSVPTQEPLSREFAMPLEFRANVLEFAELSRRLRQRQEMLFDAALQGEAEAVPFNERLMAMATSMRRVALLAARG